MKCMRDDHHSHCTPLNFFSGFILQKIIWSSSVDLSPSQGIFWPQASPIPKNLKPSPPLLPFFSSTGHVLAHLIFTTTYEIVTIILTSCHFLNPKIYWVLFCASNIQTTWHALPHLSSEIGTVIIPNLQTVRLRLNEHIFSNWQSWDETQAVRYQDSSI